MKGRGKMSNLMEEKVTNRESNVISSIQDLKEHLMRSNDIACKVLRVMTGKEPSIDDEIAKEDCLMDTLDITRILASTLTDRLSEIEKRMGI